MQLSCILLKYLDEPSGAAQLSYVLSKYLDKPGGSVNSSSGLEV